MSSLKTLKVAHLVKNCSGFDGRSCPEPDETSPSPRCFLKNSLFAMKNLEHYSRSSSQQFFRFLPVLDVYYRVHGPLHLHTLSQSNPAHILTHSFVQTHLITSYHIRLSLPTDMCFSRFLPEFIYISLIFSTRAMSPAHLILLV
jgi:hypothetical protein